MSLEMKKKKKKSERQKRVFGFTEVVEEDWKYSEVRTGNYF